MSARKASLPARRKEKQRSIPDPVVPAVIKPGKTGSVKRTKEPMKVGRPVTGD